jgi:hypothetical protein
MNDNNLIANKIEEVIGRIFAHFRSVDLGVTEYSIFYNQRMHASWFIVVFFADKKNLWNGLKNGICYQIHTYLSKELDKFPETANIVRSISFEEGRRPEEKIETDKLFEHLVQKQKALSNAANETNNAECTNCGHDFNKHELRCNLNEDSTTPTEGWIICPDENCNCFQTWSANYKAEI